MWYISSDQKWSAEGMSIRQWPNRATVSATLSMRLFAARRWLAGRKEIAMLVPLIFLILPVTVAFALFPGYLVLQAGF